MRAFASKLQRRAPGARVEGVELAVVGADQHELVHDGRPGVDVATRLRGPRDLAGGGDQRVHAAVGGSDVDAPVGDRRGGVEVALLQSAVAAEAGRAPASRPAARRVAVDVAVVGADDEQPAAVGRRALDGAAHVHAPAAMARPGVERRERAVLGAEVERAVDEEGGGLGARADAVAPDALAGGAAHGDHDASERGDVETLLVQRRAGRERWRDLARPAALARLRVERDDAALGGLDIHAVLVDDGRELRQRVQSCSPYLRERRPLLRLRVLPVVGRIEAPARPGDGLVGRDLLDDLGIRARVLGGGEVRDGAAVHVLGRAQGVAEESASADHDDRGHQQRAPAASPAGARVHRRHGRTAFRRRRLVGGRRIGSCAGRRRFGHSQRRSSLWLCSGSDRCSVRAHRTQPRRG